MMPHVRPPLRALLIDLSGTLHTGSNALPGSVTALERLRAHEQHLPFRFCSNTSKESTQDLCRKLASMGFNIKQEPKELWTSIGEVKEVINKKGLKRPYYILSDSAVGECKTEGAQLAEDQPYDSVVVGLAPASLDYAHLNEAFRILSLEHPSQAHTTTANNSKRSRPPLIATHRAKVIGDKDGALSLGPGHFVRLLEQTVGVEAEIVGKPSEGFFRTTIESMHLPKSDDGRIAIIGDDIEADLGGAAVELGLWRVLVRTGKYRPGDETREGVTPPDEVVDSFASFIDDLLKTQSKL